MNTGTMSMRVTRVIRRGNTYAVLALAGFIASFSGAADKADKVDKEPLRPSALMIPGKPNQWKLLMTREEAIQWKIEAAQRETPLESVRLLMQDRLMETTRSNIESSHSGERVRKAILKDPRIAKLMDLARNGSEEQRASLLAEIKKMCRYFIEQLPLAPENGEDLSPTVVWPGGAKAYPLLLGALDDKAETLPLLLEMQTRHLYACRKRLAETYPEYVGGYEEAEQMPMWGDLGFMHVVAYACAELLDKCGGTPVLYSALTPRQAQVLDEFAEFNDKTGPDGERRMRNEAEIFRIAEDFVKAAKR